jgi:hypothetical protein
MGERCALKIRKPSALTKNYMPLILWREDVEELVSILKLRGASIEIVKGDYSFETLDEFENYAGPNSQTNVKIVSGQPYTSIELAPWQASLYVAGTHEQASGIFFELDKVLAGHQRRWPILYSLWFANVIVWGCYGVTLGARYVGAPWQVSEAATYVQVAALVWLLWIALVRFRRHSIVRMERRARARSFFQRNKDQLVIAIVAAVLEAVLGAVGTKVVEKITSRAETKATAPANGSNP